MSRVGKKEIIIPDGINVEIKEDEVIASKDKQTLSIKIVPLVNVVKSDKKIIVEKTVENKKSRAQHGLMRNLIFNMVIGLKEPFKKVLDIKGIGYKAKVEGNKLVVEAGYSHQVVLPIPEGVSVDIDTKANQAIIKGSDKQLVGEYAATVRRVRPPEPYKGTGIKYFDEYIKRKAGKAAGATGGKK